MKRILTLAALAAMMLVSCSHNEPSEPSDTGDDPQVPSEYPGYTRVPLSSQLSGVQPMTGIVMWVNRSGAPKENYQLDFSYMLYNDVCKEKDVYDWSVVDKLLANVASNGHQAVLRFRYTYPGYNCAVPDYIKALPDYEETSGRSEGARTTFPDWRHPELQRFHMEFYRLFAERYDNDPRIAFLETGFGLWAEYHIYDGPFKLGQTFPSKEFQAEFLTNMGKWFVKTPWLISIDAADSKYGPFRQSPEVLDVDFGNFDDSFMCQDHDGYNRSSWLFFGADRYKRAPGGGEFSYYTDYDQRHCIDTAGIHGRRFEDEVARYHLSFIIGNDVPRYQKWPRIIEASMSMGYRFRINDFLVKPGSGAVVWVENAGVAPIYYDAFVAVEGAKGEFNLRQLMPGEEAKIEISSPSVSESSVPSIICERLVPGQKIEYEADVQ